VTPDSDRVTLIIANEFAPPADEKFWYPLQGTSSGLILKPVGGDFLSFLPRAGEGLICFPKLVNASSARPCHSGGGHTTGVRKRFLKSSLSRFGGLQFSHWVAVSPAARVAGPRFRPHGLGNTARRTGSG
jgi:hypothetical protein